MLKVGIVGYGNLGIAVEREIMANKDFELIKIFSRRNKKLLYSPFGSQFENTKNLERYVSKIEILFLCGGSFSDIEEIGVEAIKHFCTVDAFDTHKKLLSHKNNLDKIAKKTNHVALTAFGWDPGILSAVRVLFSGIAGENNLATFWGDGVSQGHSDALRRLPGIENAIQFTIPNKKEIANIQKYPNYHPKEENKHKRICYVATQIVDKNSKLDKGYNFEKNQQQKTETNLKKQIKSLPNYFAGQKTVVHFVQNDKVIELQKNMKHKGLVISHWMQPNCYEAKMKFEVEMQNNPSFTARIMIVGANIVSKYIEEKKYGGYSILDIPPRYFFDDYNKLL